MITVADLLAPEGPVEKTLFPGEGDGTTGTALESRLATYITKAYEVVSQVAFSQPDEAATNWALHLTFEAAYVLACSRPSNENDMVPVLGSRGYTKDQRDAIKAKSNEYLAAYNTLLTTDTIGTTPTGIPSRSVPTVYEW